MNIIITGVAGFIGSNLAHALLKSGHKVVGIDNFSFGCRANLVNLGDFDNFNFIEGDIRQADCLQPIGGDCIVHLASHKIPRYTSAFETLSSNSLMLKNVIESANRKSMRVVFASTSDIYGKNPDLPYTEESNSVLGPTTVKRWAYATSKIFSEQLIQAWHADHDLEYTIMRFFGSYGPNQNRTWWGGPQSVFIQNIIDGKPLTVHGDGQQTRTFTYIDDTVQGIQLCIEREEAKNQIFNIAGEPDWEITILDLAKLIASLMKSSDPKIELIPYSTFGKYEDVRRRVPCIQRIKNSLGYIPKFGLTEGLTKTIEWQTSIAEYIS